MITASIILFFHYLISFGIIRYFSHHYLKILVSTNCILSSLLWLLTLNPQLDFHTYYLVNGITLLIPLCAWFATHEAVLKTFGLTYSAEEKL